MAARSNASEVESFDGGGEESRFNRRIELRYRFAQLLTLEKFDEALREAWAAHGKEEISPGDLQFVVEIVKGAERMGRIQIDRSRYPMDSVPDFAAA